MLRAGGCRWQDTRCGRADAAGQDAHTQCRTVRSPQHCLSWVAPPATEPHPPMIAHGCRSRTRSRGGWGRRPQCEVPMRYPAPLAFRSQGLANAESWQDLHVVHDSRGLCSEKGPFLARYSRGVSSNGDLQGFSDAWRAYLAKASSFRMRGGDILPRRGPFPVRGLFWDTPGQNIAIVRHPGTHNVNISPPPGAWEYNSRAYAAMPDRPMTHRGSISPAKPPFGYARGSMLVPTVPRPSPSAGCGGAQLRRWAPPR